MTTIFQRERRMPSLAGATEWLNSEPLSPAGLQGRVVLVDFGTYTCINWLRTLPHIRAWAEKYREHGLVVVGIQTPEFEFEQSLDSVRREVKARGIDWPVAVDNRYEIWRAFNNNYWPALYFVDREGVVRHHHFGEGRYEQSERVIQRLLGVTRQDLVTVDGEGDEAEADWARLNSPETYLGYERTDNFASPGGVGPGRRASTPLPTACGSTTGRSPATGRCERERVSLKAAGGRISFRFQARDVHLVLRRAGQGEPVPFRVLLDGEASRRRSRSRRRRRRQRPPRRGSPVPARPPAGRRRSERTFEITFHAGGVEAYVFTFG